LNLIGKDETTRKNPKKKMKKRKNKNKKQTKRKIFKIWFLDQRKVDLFQTYLIPCKEDWIELHSSWLCI